MSPTDQQPLGAPIGQIASAAFRAVLVHVQAEPAAQARLTSAAALAHRLGATLYGVGAELIDPIFVFDDNSLLNMEDTIAANLRAAERAFKASSEGLSTEWLSLEEKPAAAVARVSRGADIIVAGGAVQRDQSSYRWCDPAELVMLSGRPVLVVPATGGHLNAEAIVVAWKDTRESRRALADAMPFLVGAREVLVVEVCDEVEVGEAQARTFEVVVGLKRHGVKARAQVVTGATETVARELNVAAAAVGADLIVAGGYGHSRVGEWVFGGATQDLLHKPERFVLLSH